MRRIYFSLFVLLILALTISIFPGCDCNEVDSIDERVDNIRPVVEIVMPPAEDPGSGVQISTLPYDVNILWRSNDLDGKIVGNFYRWIHINPDGTEEQTMWYWTEVNQLTAELSVKQKHIFEIIAVDNRASWEGFQEIIDKEKVIKYSGIDQELFLDKNDDGLYNEGDECLAYYNYGTTERMGLTPGVQTPIGNNLSPIKNYMEMMDHEQIIIAPFDTTGAVSAAATYEFNNIISNAPETYIVEPYPPKIMFVPKDKYLGGHAEENWLGQTITVSMKDEDKDGNEEGTPTEYSWAIGRIELIDILKSHFEYYKDPSGSVVPLLDLGDTLVTNILSDSEDNRTLQAWTDWTLIPEDAEYDQVRHTYTFPFVIDDASIFPQTPPDEEFEYALFVRSRDNANQEEMNLTPMPVDQDSIDYPYAYRGLDKLRNNYNAKPLTVVSATFEKGAILVDNCPGIGVARNYFKDKLAEVLSDYDPDNDFVELKNEVRLLKATDLAPYKTMIFISLVSNPSTVMQDDTEGQQSLLKEYLKAGGHLWLDAEKLGTLFGETPTNLPPKFVTYEAGDFLYDALHIKGVASNQGVPPGEYPLSSPPTVEYPNLTRESTWLPGVAHPLDPRSDAEVIYQYINEMAGGEKYTLGIRYTETLKDGVTEEPKLVVLSFPLAGASPMIPKFDDDIVKELFTKILIEDFDTVSGSTK